MGISGLEMADLVREVSYDVGTGPLRLDGAMAGYRPFAGAVGVGAAFPYVIVGTGAPLQWEAGTGTLDGDGRLAREPVASSADGAAVDFAAGEKRVGLAVHAGWIDAVERHGHGLGEIDGLTAALAGKQAASGTGEQDQMNLFVKDPQARIDHEIDWSAYLAAQTLVASSWAVEPAEAGGLTVAESAFEDRRSSARLSGGVVGRLYRLTNHVILSDGQADERSVTIRVEER